MHPVVPLVQEHRRISKQLSLLQNLLTMVCLMDARARVTAEACASVLEGRQQVSVVAGVEDVRAVV